MVNFKQFVLFGEFGLISIVGMVVIFAFCSVLTTSAIIVGMLRPQGWVLTYARLDLTAVEWTIEAMDTERSLIYLFGRHIQSSAPPILSRNRRYVVETWNGGVRLLDLETDQRLPLGGGCCPSLSPDNRYLTYKGDGVLYLIDLHQPDIHHNVLGDVSVTQTKPALWLPDSTWLLVDTFQWEDHSPNLSLYHVNIQTREAEKVIDLPSWDFQLPALSPDGQQIAFAADFDDLVGLYTVDIARKNLHYQTRSISPNTRPVWSPDSQAIAFLSAEVFGYYGLYIYRFDGTVQGPIHASVSETQMVWSPDGTRLAFVSRQDNQVYIANLEGERTPVERITSGGNIVLLW